MNWLYLLLLPIGIFSATTFCRWFLGFCFDNNHRWWGGMSLWVSGFVCFILPLFVASVLVPISLTLGG